MEEGVATGLRRAQRLPLLLRHKGKILHSPVLRSAVGKFQRRPPVASSAAGINQLFYINDTSSKRRFLVDTGAQVRVIPASPHERQGIP